MELKGGAAAQQQERTGRQDAGGALRRRPDPPAAGQLSAAAVGPFVGQSAAPGTQTIDFHSPFLSQRFGRLKT